MRLIDADAICYHKMWEEDWTKQTIYFGPGVPEWEIDEMPTVDAVPVIRCKDCTYYRGDHEYCVNDMFAVESGFCNWAERKEE